MPGFNSANAVAETIIDAPPKKVREVLLDMEKWPEWKNKQQLINNVHIERAGTGEMVPAVEAKVGDQAKINSVQAGDVVAILTVRALCWSFNLYLIRSARSTPQRGSDTPAMGSV